MENNGKRGAELKHSSIEDLKLFELEKSPIINVEINLELIPLFLYKTRRRSERAWRPRTSSVRLMADVWSNMSR